MAPSSDRDAATSCAAIAWARRFVAVAILVGGVIALNAGSLDSCAQTRSPAGQVVSVCQRPGVDDPVVVGTLLLVLVLLAPDLSEFSVLGLATLKLRVRAQEARSDATEAELRSLRIEVAHASANSTAQAAQSQTVLVDVGTALRSAEWAGAPHEAPGGAGSSRTARGSASTGPAGPDPPPDDSPAGQPPAGSALERRREIVAGARAFVGDVALHGVLGAAAADLRELYGIDSVRTHAYLPNDDGLLLPVDDPTRPADQSGWPPGVGLVGTVWDTGQAEIRRGDLAHQDLDRLPTHRRRRYAGTQLVVAVPIRNFARRAIGVLSASSFEHGDPTRDTDVVPILVAHGEALARVVIDLFGWDTDDAAGG